MPDKTTIPEPSKIYKLGFSPKRTIPKDRANNTLTYLNGVTNDTSPTRIAIVKQKYALTPAAALANKNINASKLIDVHSTFSGEIMILKIDRIIPDIMTI